MLLCKCAGAALMALAALIVAKTSYTREQRLYIHPLLWLTQAQ